MLWDVTHPPLQSQRALLRVGQCSYEAVERSLGLCDPLSWSLWDGTRLDRWYVYKPLGIRPGEDMVGMSVDGHVEGLLNTK